jgi:hypothetical protein
MEIKVEKNVSEGETGGAWGAEFLRSELNLSDAVAAKPYIIPIRMSIEDTGVALSS